MSCGMAGGEEVVNFDPDAWEDFLFWLALIVAVGSPG